MKRSIVVLSVILVVVLGLSVNMAVSNKPTLTPGQQMITARWTDKSPVIDGNMGSGEYSAAIPEHVTFTQHAYPGVVGWFGTPNEMPWPKNPDDLSFTIYAMYDKDNLYIAVDVADDHVINDGPDIYFDSPDGGITWNCIPSVEPWRDDDVELLLDGDHDGVLEGWTTEGYQYFMDAGGDIYPFYPPEWKASAGLRPRGYMVEFMIPLSYIDTKDGGGEIPPKPGDIIGFNVAVGDDDNGSLPYNGGQLVCDCPQFTCPGGVPCDPMSVFVTPDEELTDTYGMWDGTGTWNAADYGHLYFEPQKGKAKKPVAEASTWGRIKSLLK